VKLASAELEKAAALGSDLDLAKRRGEYYRTCYDIENELRVYVEFLKDHPNEAGANALAADAYDRLRRPASSGGLFVRPAQTGDAESRLRLGLSAERQGRLDEAIDALKDVTTAPGGVGGRASAALARVALAQGRVAEAATHADQAKLSG